MGVLIVLLVIVTREANLQADQQQAEVASDAEEQLRELNSIKEREQLRANLLTDLQPGLQARMGDVRLRKAHFQEQIRQLREQAEGLLAQWQTMANDDAAVNNQQLLSELQQVEVQIESARLALDSARQQVIEQEKSYSVIPYPGPNGTTRRPIYIECTREGIYLQPYGILLTREHLNPPILTGNPLDASLLAIREYWQRFGGMTTAEEPYPLIIVRPDGAEAYAVVRQSMKSWDDEFGYELVGDDVQLEFPGEDPQLSELLEQVVAESTARHEQLQIAVAYQQQGQRVSDGIGQTRATGDAYAQLTGQGGSSRSESNGLSDGSRRSDGRIEGLTFRATSNRGGFVADSQNGASVSDQLNTRAGSSTSGRLASSSTSFGEGDFNQQGSGGYGDQGSSRTVAGTGQQAGAGQVGTEQSATENGESLTNRQGLRRPDGYGQPGSGQSADRQSAASEFGGTAGDQASNRFGADGQGNLNIGSQGSTSQSNSSAQQTPQQSSSLASAAQQLANARGDDWALPSKTPTATAFRKPIQIACSADRLIIYPGAYSQQPIREVQLRGETVEHVDEMVDAIWRLIDSWGFAGYNAYYKPELRLSVEADGEQRFRDLEALMQGSGLEIKRRSP